MKKRKISVLDTQIGFLEHGHGDFLILLPGFHYTAEEFKPIIRLLGRNFKVVAPDIPGFGMTPELPKGKRHSIKKVALYLDKFRKELGVINGILVGVSLSSIVAIRMLQRNSRWVKHLVIAMPFYDRKYYTLVPRLRFISWLVRTFGPRNRVLIRTFNYILGDNLLIKIYFKWAYRNRKNKGNIVKYQVMLNKKMHTRAVLEVMYDFFSLSLSKENLNFSIRTSILETPNDPLVKEMDTLVGLQKIFVNSEIVFLNLPDHSPGGQIDREFLSKISSEINIFVTKLSL